ncbi:MAG: alpha/beta hydrolase [Hyphobacterium sp.]|nr:MAG: alpha/beta hydrolase [Hyphobacterium sp.]
MTVLTLAWGALNGCASLPAESARINGADMHYTVLGSGTPVVVFEAGLGDGRSSWRGIARALSEDTTVVIYDRPGYSRVPFSDTRFDSDRDGRSGAEIATALHTLLDGAGMSGPYILAGHSIGGIYVQSFARLYPEDTAALVLIDGRPPRFTRHCIEENAGMCTIPTALKILMDTHVRAEIDGMDQTLIDLQNPADLGPLPMVVLAATRPGGGASERFQQLWLQDQSTFAAQALNARYIEVEGAGHYIHRQRPDVVLTELRRVISDLRETRSLPENDTD